MSEKVFVVGRSGSGKTTAINILAECMQQRAISFACLKDYQILYDMYLEDMKQYYRDDKKRKFRPAEYGGFEVRDYSVFDKALTNLEKQVKGALRLNKNGIIAIEFARNDYHEVFSKLDPDILRGASVLFIDCEVNICIQRIYARLTDPPRPDFHFVPERIMRSYFDTDNFEYMERRCQYDFPQLKMVKAIDNTELLFDEFQRQIESFAQFVVNKVSGTTSSTVSSSSATKIKIASFNHQIPLSESHAMIESVAEEKQAIPA